MPAKSALITQSNYIPWKGYFDAVHMADVLVLLDEVQYTRRDWRNRNQIKTRDGLKWLSIPVQTKGKYIQKIQDTKISDPGWARKHWSSLVHTYSKTPCFSAYANRFEGLYLDRDYIYLSEVNRVFIEAVNEILQIDTAICCSSEFGLSEKGNQVVNKTQRIVDICKQIGAERYLTGPAAKPYLEESRFEREGIEIVYLDYSGYPEYPQINGPFEHAVTVLDLIFNVGDEAHKYMKSFGIKHRG